MEGKPLREVTIKIGLERLDMQEGITVEALLDSGATGLVMSSEFARKKGFKLKKLERPMQVRNVDGSFNREGLIENTVEVNVYYKGHVERTEIDVIGGQKWGVILGMPWLEHHNPEIDWKTGEVKITRCPEECGRQWRPVQGKLGWEKQKEEEAKEEAEKRKDEKEKKKKQKKGKTVEVRKVAEEWEIWDEEEEVTKSEEEAKKLVPEKFHRWIKVFGKKQSERMSTRKLWDHAIDVKEGFMPRKGKVYPLLREEREEVREFVKVIGPEGIKMEKEKVKGVLEWPTPKCVKDIQKFLGLANYYCWFIEGFATVARPLHDLVKRDKKWEWTEREENAFKELKERFTKEPVLVAPDIDKKMRMEVDALDYAMEGVLSMECEDGLWRPVAFLSKSLNETERNYEIHDKEMLAIIRGLEAWRHLLEGAQYKFEIWTDHKNLEYFMKVQKLNRRQARWALYLSRFDFTLKHVAGSKMGKADGLSRRADWKVGTDKDNENQLFIKDQWICSMYEVVVEGPEVGLVEKIRKARSKNEDVVKIVEEMKKAGVRELRGNEWKIEGDLVLKEEKIYVPKDEKLRGEVIRLHYDVPAAGHGGRWKTVELVTRNYWWPGVTRDVGKYVEGCDLCQRIKNRTEEPAGKLKLSEVPQKMWSHLTVDFITKLPVVAGKDAILVVCDRLSKMTHFVATTEGTSVEGLARLFRDNIWKLHGLPESVVSNRGPQFAAELTKELNRMLWIKTKLSTAFHPQTDGQTERMNQELEQYLWFFVEHRQKDWPEWLAAAEFAVNNKVHMATKVSPFMANYGKELRMGGDIRRKGKVESATAFVERMKKVQEEAEAALRKTQEEMKRYADRGRKETEVWKKRDRVLLSTKDLVFKERPSKKLTERYVGPYVIEEVVSSNAVKLRLPSSMRIHPVINVSRIVRYKEQVKGQKKEEGKPVEVEGVEEWEVEKILNKKKIRGVEKYLIRWKGFTAEGDTWERKENLKNAEELIKEFERGEVVVRQEVEEEGEYKRMELLGKYTAKLLYGWDDRKFEEEYLNKLEKNWKKWKGDRQINESEYLERIEERMEEKNKKMRGRDWRTGHFSGGEILRGK